METNESQGTLWESVESACAVAPRDDAVLPGEVADALRSAYFAQAGELAIRYGVGACDVIAHLERAGLARGPRPERAVANIRCAVHGTALALGVAQAWADLLTALGPGFDRACVGRLDRQDGIAFARRFWIDLREATLGQAPRAAGRRRTGGRTPDLRNFSATRPLRHWLAERLLGSLETELGRAASAAERLDTVQEVRTLRIPAPMAAGAETRR